eukprot:TRINITY_DN1055_c0_g1_i12.p1 TRINITY_DN1055_c0_g1~~TRINITY_DN1055_c0_g1_i12.p1  ORF type:complete len:114 (-),score=16.89 TRINITY_DN1055_c0_g1_i12:840-1181(-)
MQKVLGLFINYSQLRRNLGYIEVLRNRVVHEDRFAQHLLVQCIILIDHFHFGNAVVQLSLSNRFGAIDPILSNCPLSAHSSDFRHWEFTIDEPLGIEQLLHSAVSKIHWNRVR